MNPLLPTFLVEARELVQQATDDLLALEGDPLGPIAGARIEGAFRAFHTLKGASALFAFRPMTAALHAAEDLFAATREADIADDPTRLVDVALACLDQVARWLDGIEARGELPSTAEAEAAAVEAALRQVLTRAPDNPGAAMAHADAAEAGDPAPAWIASLTEAERVALGAARRDPEGAALAISYDPDPDCFLRGEDPLALIRRTPGLALLRIEAREPWPDPVRMDPFSCNLRIRAVAFGPRAEIEGLFRVIGGQARVAAIPPEALRLSAPDRRGAAALVRAVLEEQLRLLRDPGAAEERAGRIGAACRAAANALRYAGNAAAAAQVEAAGTDAAAARDPARAAAAIAAAGAALVQDAATASRPTAAQPLPEAPSSLAWPASAARALRVDPARVDRLVSLADEMALARNGLLAFARRAEAELGGTHRDLVRVMREHCAAVERLTQEWYNAATRLRLLPLDQVFRRFPRLVRERARDLGKRVELRISGAETEADRDVLDRLAEPLLHLLRNSLDHGVEPPEERRRAGKAEIAILALRAFHEGNRLVIEVADDGRGVDPAALRRRAIARGLLDPGRTAALSDPEALELVFVPGLSTAEAVSDLSGRGIGMDVVRRTIQALGGAVALQSSPGRGTTVRLGLPLHITLTRILTVAIGSHLFGLPLRAVARTLHVPRNRIRPLGEDGAEAAFAHGDRLVPLIPLRHLLGLPDPSAPAGGASERNAAHVVLIETEGQEAGLEVDTLGERLEVVLRPLEGLLAGTPGYLGTTLLGSGRVMLVLDPDGLMR